MLWGIYIWLRNKIDAEILMSQARVVDSSDPEAPGNLPLAPERRNPPPRYKELLPRPTMFQKLARMCSCSCQNDDEPDRR